MRVDFRARFEDVLKLTQAPTTRSQSGAGFASLLSDLVAKGQPGTEQPQGITTNSAVDLTPSPGKSTAMAMLKLEPPGLELPSLTPRQPDTNIAPTEDEAVKAPVIVGAKRLAPRTSVVTDEEYHRILSGIEEWGKKAQIDPALSKAVAESESSFDPGAVSSDGHGSKGLFQLLDKTGLDFHGRLGISEDYDPFNPEQNTQIGVSYLRHLHDIFSQSTDLRPGLSTVSAANSSSLEKLAVAAFNAGEGRVASAQKAALKAGRDPSNYEHVTPYLPTITQSYVERVISARARFAGSEEVA